MKRLILLTLNAALTLTALAQDSYLNAEITNQADLIGTSRYVGMGGALGALGADISCISINPAGIALFRRADISLTAGGLWQPSPGAPSPSSGTVDQAGFVTTFSSEGKVCNFNLAFNYQRRKNYMQDFVATILTPASWAHESWNMSDIAYERIDNFDLSTAQPYRSGLYNESDWWNTLYGQAEAYGLYQPSVVSTSNSTYSRTSGAIHGFDLNLSANIDDRVYVGFTAGLDNVNFNKYTDYWEVRSGYLTDPSTGDPLIDPSTGTPAILDHSFGYGNTQRVRGNGFNFKFGAIVRLMESSTFRVGATVETPTWYTLDYTDDQTLITKYNGLAYDFTQDLYHNHPAVTSNQLRYKLSTPWKFRVQAGSTISNLLAWGAEYEYAGYQYTNQRYPEPSYYAGYYYVSGGSVKDDELNQCTRNILRGQHTIRLGAEVKPLHWLSLRAGYNYITSIYHQDSYWSPSFTSNTVEFPTSFEYHNITDTHIATAGIGFRLSKFYIDLAYKNYIRKGNYNPFDSYNTFDAEGKPIAAGPVSTDLSRHQITATIGYKF